MNGKSKCKILKQIRQRIADENDIAYVTSECKYQGDCAGTCPKCESELQYLENELRKRQAAGKAVAVAGIAATLMLGLTACAEEEVHNNVNAGTPPASSSTAGSTGDIPASTDRIEIEGDIALPPEDELLGEPTVEDELGGDPSLEDDEVTAGVPPEQDSFYDEEPGIDTGDWGALH